VTGRLGTVIDRSWIVGVVGDRAQAGHLKEVRP
jgi:hypothetical protein